MATTPRSASACLPTRHSCRPSRRRRRRSWRSGRRDAVGGAAIRATAEATMRKLKTISDVRLFFHRNERPIYFISATNFNLAGIDERVQHFKYINYIDCFDGRHPNVFVPKETPHEEFESIEDITNYLLEHKEVIDYIKGRGGNPVAVFLMFD